jgi:hypothetical protein
MNIIMATLMVSHIDKVSDYEHKKSTIMARWLINEFIESFCAKIPYGHPKHKAYKKKHFHNYTEEMKSE